MKNSLEITRKYQFLYMLGRHFTAVLICFVIEAVAFYGFFTKPLARYIVSGIFTVVYGGMLYSGALKLAGFDRKNYTPLKPEIKWGIMWGVMISAIMAVFMIVFKVNRAVNSIDGNTVLMVVINIIFYIAVSPFWGFIGGSGEIPGFAAAIMLTVPLAACTAGYLAGMKNFDVINKIDSMTFEKDD